MPLGTMYEQETAFYHEGLPWNKGTKVDQALTAKEAIVAAGLDWTVESVPIYTNNAMGKRGTARIPGRRAIQRQTDGKVLGVLGNDYKPVQNIDAFEFFDTVVADRGAKYEAAGALMGGKRIWLLAKLNGGNGQINIEGDEVDKYLLLFNGHDGGLALKMFFMPFRLWCLNVLSTADTRVSREAMFYARHTDSLPDKVLTARDILGISLNYYNAFAETANNLAKLQLPAAEMPKLLAAAFGTSGAIRVEDVVSLDDFSKRRQEQLVTVTRLFEGEGKGLDQPAIKGTKWAAYNAITEYVDHYRPYKGDNADELRLRNTWFSRGGSIKTRAWNYLTK